MVGATGGVTLNTSGALAINAAVNAGAGNVDLTTTGAGPITQSAAGIITANTLTLATANSNATLNTVTNVITNLGVTTLGSGALNLLDAGGLTVTGAVGATGGITMNTSGALALNAAVNAGAGNVDLTTTGAGPVTQSGAGIITANTLTLNGAGNISLTNASNNAVNLVMSAGNDVSYTDTNALNVSALGGTAVMTGAVAISGGAVNLMTNLTGNNGLAVTGSAITATANSYVTAGGAMTFTGPVTLGAGAKTFDTTNATAAPAGGNVTYTGTVNGASTVTVSAGTTGAVNFQGAIGGGVTGLNVTGKNVSLTSASIAGSVNLTAQNGGVAAISGALTSNNNPVTLAVDDLALTGSIDSAGGAVTISTATPGTNITLGNSATGLSLSNTELTLINTGAAGAGLLTIGGTTHTGSITVGGAVNLNGANNALNLKIVNQGTVALNGALTLKTTGALNITANAGGATGVISDNGAGSLNADSITLQAQGGIGAIGAPVHIGQTAGVAASNSGTGDIYLSYTAGNATLNTMSNTAGSINVATVNGNISVAGNLNGSTAVSLAASDNGIVGGANISTTGTITSAGTVNIYAADDVTLGGTVTATGNLNIVAGTVSSTGVGYNGTNTATSGMSAPGNVIVGASGMTMSEATVDTTGTIMINAPVSGLNVTIQSTNRVGPAIGGPTQVGTIAATGTGTNGVLTVQTFNNTAQTGTINLQNTGNTATSLVLETRLASSPPTPYASSNIFYKSSSSGLTLAGLGTAATVALDAASWVLTAAPAALGATDLVLNATGTNGTIVVNTDLSNASVNSGAAGGSLSLNAHGSITLNNQIGASATNPLPSALANTAAFNHDLNLRSGASINVNGSIILGASRNLAFQANLDKATLNTLSPANNFATSLATAGGGVVVTAPNGTGTGPGLMLFANIISAGSLANRVQHFVLDGSAVTSVGTIISGQDRTTTIKASTLSLFTTSTSTQAQIAARVGAVGNVNFNSYAIPTGATGTGDVVIKGGTASGNSASKAGVLIDVGTFNTKVAGNFIFKAGIVNLGGGIADTELKIVNVNTTVDIGGNLVIVGGNTVNAGATGTRSAFARFDPLIVNTGQSLALVGGYGANTFALLTSPGNINLKVNQAAGAPATFSGPGALNGVASGLIMAGGTGTGAFNFNLLSNKIEPYTVNTLPIGSLTAPITLTGGVATIVALPLSGGLEASGASVLSNVPVIPGIDLGQQINAVDQSTKINTDTTNKNKDGKSDDGC